jgi:hypothetical protein
MKKNLVLVAILFAKFILQYILIHPAYQLHRDEYLHLDQSRHLAWGYISVPPFTSWLSWLIFQLGASVFWVKFFPALFGALTIFLVAQIIKALGGGIYAMLLGCVAVLVSGILRINILFQPNSLDIFFWTLVFYLFIRFFSNGNNKWLYLAGIAFAFGFLSKYNILFLGAGLLPAVVFTYREDRKTASNLPPSRLPGIFSRRHLIHIVAAMALTLLIISPNLLWQYNNNFPTIKQLKELADTQLVHVDRMDFVKEQFLLFASSSFIIIAALIALMIHPAFSKYRFVSWTYFVCIGLFIYAKAKGYYAMGLYPVLIAFGAVYFERLLSNGWKFYLRPVLLLLVIGLSIPFLLIGFPTKSPEEIAHHSQRYKDLGLLRWEDGKDHLLPQDFADMLGWREIAFLADKAYDQSAGKVHTLVLCDNYGQAGAINYYSVNRKINAVSFNADYINWIPLDQAIKNVVLVKEAKDTDTARSKEKPLFDTVILIGANQNIYAREKGTRVYLLKGARADINALLRKEIMSNE